MYIDQKKIITYTVVAIAILMALVGTATYAYFASSVVVGNNLLVNATTASGSYSFTSYSSGTINLNLTAQDMLASANSNTTAKKSGTASLVTNVSAPGGSSVTCTYDVVWIWESTDTYVSSNISLGTGVRQFSVQVEGSGTLAETDLSAITWNTAKTQGTLLTGATVTKNNIAGTATASATSTYNVTARLYNLNADQNQIQGKNYRARITVVNPTCSLT